MFKVDAQLRAENRVGPHVDARLKVCAAPWPLSAHLLQHLQWRALDRLGEPFEELDVVVVILSHSVVEVRVLIDLRYFKMQKHVDGLVDKLFGPDHACLYKVPLSLLHPLHSALPFLLVHQGKGCRRSRGEAETAIHELIKDGLSDLIC